MKTTLSLAAALLAASALIGCAGNSSPATTTTPTTPVLTTGNATYVYVVQDSSGLAGSVPAILQFTAGVNGATSPLSTLTLPSTADIECVATDSSGSIYVGASLSTGTVVEVFPAGSTGAATPSRTIKLASGFPPEAMFVDTSGQLYIADSNAEVLVYSSTANGTATPTRTISGALTTLGYGSDIAVDTSGTIYVATGVVSGNNYTGQIEVFASTANGNVAPQRLITNSNVFLGVATDAGNNLFATLDMTTTGGAAAIVQYASTATGAATPTRTISGSATQLSTAGALRIDANGNIYVTNQISGGTVSTSYALEKFTSSASGNVAPSASFTSSAWTIAQPSLAIK